MGENKIENLFEVSIQHSELLPFAIGEGKYFIPDREYGDHWIYGAWVQYIIPYLVTLNHKRSSEILDSMLSALIHANHISEQKKIEILLYHLHVYFYLKKEGSIKFNCFDSIFPTIQMTISEYLKNQPNIHLSSAVQKIEENSGKKIII